MKESKHDRFQRVAEARVNKIIKMVRLLGNCSGSAYEYTDDQVAQIFNALQTELDNAKERFTRAQSGRKRFSLHEDRIPVYKDYPHIALSLPDGTSLVAVAFQQGEYPAINLYWLPGEDSPEGLIALAEYNPERSPEHNLCIGAYQSDQEDTTYYEPYMAERESNEGN